MYQFFFFFLYCFLGITAPCCTSYKMSDEVQACRQQPYVKKSFSFSFLPLSLLWSNQGPSKPSHVHPRFLSSHGGDPCPSPKPFAPMYTNSKDTILLSFDHHNRTLWRSIELSFNPLSMPVVSSFPSYPTPKSFIHFSFAEERLCTWSDGSVHYSYSPL